MDGRAAVKGPKSRPSEGPSSIEAPGCAIEEIFERTLEKMAEDESVVEEEEQALS